MTDNAKYVPNQILAMVKSEVSDKDAEAAIGSAGGSIVKTTSNGRLRAILITAADVESAMEKLKSSNCFDAIQLNYLSTNR